MATRKITTETVEDASEMAEVVEVDAVEEAAESALDGILADFSGADDVSVNVYRQGEGKNISFLFKTMPEDMNGGDIMERCRDQFGTGDYRLHVRKGPRILANRSFSVEAPKDVAPTISQPQQFGTAELMAIMARQNENTQTMFANMMTAMATMFQGAHQNQPAINPVEMQNSILQGVMAMKQMAEPESKSPDAVTMLIKGMELAGSMAPKSGDTNMNDIFLKAVEAFPALAQATKASAPAQMVPRPGQGHINPPMQTSAGNVHALKGAPPSYVVPKGTVDTSKPLPPGKVEVMEPPPQNPPPDDAFITQAREHLQGLCKLAAHDKDPGIYAPMIVDQMGEEAVRGFIGHDDALQQLAAIEPTVALYPGWFSHLKEAILELIDEPDEPNESDEPIIEEEAPETDASDELTPAVVLERINDSGLRRESKQNAPVLVPSGDPETPDTRWNRGDSEPASDT